MESSENSDPKQRQKRAHPLYSKGRKGQPMQQTYDINPHQVSRTLPLPQKKASINCSRLVNLF